MQNNERYFNIFDIDSDTVKKLVTKFTNDFTMKDIIEIIKEDVRTLHSHDETFHEVIKVHGYTIDYSHMKRSQTINKNYDYFYHDDYRDIIMIPEEKYTLITISKDDKCLYASYTNRHEITYSDDLIFRFGLDTQDESDYIDVKIKPGIGEMDITENYNHGEPLTSRYASLLNESIDNPLTRKRMKRF